MSCYYFAYGSNMNPLRMQARGLRYLRIFSGRIEGLSLVFNKRAADVPMRSYANVVYDPAGRVEGVLYELSHEQEIIKMDRFETTPRYYSREIFPVTTPEGVMHAWVYIANRAMIEDDLLPERWYLEHLLAGQPWLSAGYYAGLCRTRCGEPRIETDSGVAQTQCSA